MAGKSFKRGGRWCVVVDLGRDPVTGKRKQRWVYADTKKEVEEEQTRLLRERDTGTSIDPSRQTVGEFLTHWLETIIKTKRRQTTYERYDVTIRNQLIPHIGSVRLQQLTPLHLSKMYSVLITSGLSASSITMAHNVLHGALKQALRWQLVLRNVATGSGPAVEAPDPAVNIAELWTHDETRHFLDILAGERLRAFFVVEINTGMRRGEMFGLRWSSVDLRRGDVLVREQRVKVKGGMAVQRPKTAQGRRSIVLSPDTLAILCEYRELQASEHERFGDRWEGEDFVFTSPQGKPLYPNYIDGLWRRLERRAGTSHMPFHNLRHLNATLLLDAGIHPKVVQERLGHSSITMTLDKYSHVSRDLQQSAASALDTTLRPTEKG